MPSTCSGFLDLVRFHGLARLLATRHGADLYLSCPGCPGDTTCYIGLDVRDELVLAQSTPRSAIKDFSFSDTGPVFGFLSYTYGMGLRGVSTTKQSCFPLGHLKKYRTLLTYDLATGKYSLDATDASALDLLKMAIDRPVAHQPSAPSFRARRPIASMDRNHYIQAVERALEHILAGDTYQLNLSTRFSFEIDRLDAADLGLSLWRRYPAPFYALFNSAPYRIVSTSPERFFAVKDGRVLSQPIKGTLAFDAWTPDLEKHLTGSAKESAELSMIVDLIRNDMSMNCAVGSVRVSGHKSVFRVDNLLQMYSNVTGTLGTDRDVLDLLLDAFPGGSITGCPKKRSMEIIDQLEPHSRDIYCGSFVRIQDERNMDASIAIRTGYCKQGSNIFHFFAGSGIVVDSIPEREYEETLAKAHKFLELSRS